jgi:hypothetical protein
MPAETVRIDDFQLRVPGLSAEEARQLGQEVARRVAEELSVQGRMEHLGALELGVSIAREMPRDRLAEEIARAVVEKLK